MNLSTSSSKRLLLALFLFYLLAIALLVRSIDITSKVKREGFKSEAWASEVTALRRHFYDQARDKTKATLFIVTGSNALFSTDSAMLAEKFNMNIENWGLHAGFNVDILFSQMANRVQAGDIIIAPLEWNHYNREKYQAFDFDNYFYHFEPQAPLPWQKRAELQMGYVASTEAKFWLNGLLTYVTGPTEATNPYEQLDGEELKKAWDKEHGVERYSFLGLNERGDFHFKKPMTEKTWQTMGTPPPVNLKSRAASQLHDWKSFFEAKGAKFYLTPPIILDGKNKILTTSAYWQEMEKMREDLAENETPLRCNLPEFTFTTIYRFDTMYHCNQAGAALWTAALAQCLESLLAGSNEEYPLSHPDEIAQNIAERFERQREGFGKGDLPFQQRLRTITLLRDNILKHHQRHGRYPAAITHVPEILRDTLYYWSNGRDYALLVEGLAEDCPVINDNWPTMIMPSKAPEESCAAYGYWSSLPPKYNK